MALPQFIHASDGGVRPSADPSHRRGRVLVLECDEPNHYTVILHSAIGTSIRTNVGVGEKWRIKIKDGHHLDFKLLQVGRFPGPMMLGYRTRPAEFETSHAVDCPVCSGLAKGSAAHAIQHERARKKLAKQCL